MKKKLLHRKSVGSIDESKENWIIFPLVQSIIVIAAQLTQPTEHSLVPYHLKTKRLYTGLFKFEFGHYLTNVAQIKVFIGVDLFYV